MILTPHLIQISRGTIPNGMMAHLSIQIQLLLWEMELVLTEEATLYQKQLLNKSVRPKAEMEDFWEFIIDKDYTVVQEVAHLQM